MQMRLSVEDVRRRTAASWFALEDKQEARRVEDMRLLDRLFEGYGKCRREFDSRSGTSNAYAQSHGDLLWRCVDTWRIAILAISTIAAFLDILSIVYWIRQLRLAGRATLDCGLARDICNFTDEKIPTSSVVQRS